MRPCLCTSASSDVVLDLNPIFAEYFKSFDEFFMFFLGPSTPMRVDVLRGFSLRTSCSRHQLRCVILLLSYIRISEAHALGGNSHQAEVILVQRRFVLVSNSAIRWGLLILQCGFPLTPCSAWLLTGLFRIIFSELLRLCVVSEYTSCIHLIIIIVFSDMESISL